MVAFIVGDALSSILLCAVVLLVLVGNTLVVAAVATTRKLRTVTNVFIVNLACADLFLGVFVLPFSAVFEIVDIWIFGRLWCQVWLAVDVWLCTASILNLCCISLDRYLAITRPIRYPGLMSSRRAKMLVAGVWFFSFIIACPPLIGWNDTNEDILIYNETTTTPPVITNTVALSITACNSEQNATLNVSCSEDEEFMGPTTCELTNSRGYRIYAALGSFFIPMLVMVFFYLQIYRAAVRTISAYEKGELKTKYSVRKSTNGTTTNSVTLRIHRGGRGFSTNGNGSVVSHGCSQSGPGLNSNSSRREGVTEKERSIGGLGRGEGFVGQTSIRKARSSDASLVTLTDLASEALDNGTADYSPSPESGTKRQKSLSWRKDKKGHEDSDQRVCQDSNQNGRDPRFKICSTRCASMESDESSSGDGKIRIKRVNEHQKASQNSSLPLSPSASAQTVGSEGSFVRGSSVYDHKPRRSRFSTQKPANAIKLHMQKFNREKKAAKTLAIIVGAFIMCWMPFFTIYLVGAFCELCISPVVFSIFFWLGYCNSAMNPCVYALFSSDFRFAFRKLLTCKCRTWQKNRNFRPPSSDVPAIQFHCAPQDDAKSSSDIDGQWR